jgi:hypothetical protein
MLPRWHYSERVMCFQSRGGGSCGSGGHRYCRKHEVNETRNTATPSEMSCQRGNIAVTFYYWWRKECSAVTARPRQKEFQHLRLETHDMQHFSLLIFIRILPYNRVLLWPRTYGTPRIFLGIHREYTFLVSNQLLVHYMSAGIHQKFHCLFNSWMWLKTSSWWTFWMFYTTTHTTTYRTCGNLSTRTNGLQSQRLSTPSTIPTRMTSVSKQSDRHLWLISSTDSMKHCPSWVKQEIPNLSRNSNAHYRVHNSLQLDPNLSQMNPIHALTPRFFHINNDIILLPVPRFVCISHRCHASCYMLRPSHPDLLTQIRNGEENRLLSSLFCSFFQLPVMSSLLNSNTECSKSLYIVEKNYLH